MSKDPLDGVDPRLAIVTIQKQCGADSKRWFPEAANDLGIAALGLCGEAGEFADIVKKISRGSLKSSDAKVRMDLAVELTDVFIYLMNTANMLQINLYESYKQKRTFNEARFGPGKETRNG